VPVAAKVTLTAEALQDAVVRMRLWMKRASRSLGQDEESQSKPGKSVVICGIVRDDASEHRISMKCRHMSIDVVRPAAKGTL
jgi:hypothetical protein